MASPKNSHAETLAKSLKFSVWSSLFWEDSFISWWNQSIESVCVKDVHVRILVKDAHSFSFYFPLWTTERPLWSVLATFFWNACHVLDKFEVTWTSHEKQRCIPPRIGLMQWFRWDSCCKRRHCRMRWNLQKHLRMDKETQPTNVPSQYIQFPARKCSARLAGFLVRSWKLTSELNKNALWL